MTHSAAMAGEILPGKTILEALNTDLVCDAINVAMRELFLQIVYGRSQTAFSENGLPVGAGLDDLGKGLRSHDRHHFLHQGQGRPLSGDDRGLHHSRPLWTRTTRSSAIKFVRLGKMMEDIRHGEDPKEAYEKNIGTYGRSLPSRALSSTSTRVKNKREGGDNTIMATFEVTESPYAQDRGLPQGQYGLESLDACNEMLPGQGHRLR